METPKKILILSANPKNTPRIRTYEEVHKIEAALNLAKNRHQFSIHQIWKTDLKSLRRALLDYMPDIVHIVGHGKEDGLILEDEYGYADLIHPDGIVNLFELFKNQIECLFLSVCYSVKLVESISKYIPYVIGMTKEITDKASIEFAVKFYSEIFNGLSVEDAFMISQNSLRLSGTQDHLTPVLGKQSKSFAQYQHTAKVEIRPPNQKILILATNPKATPRLRFDEEIREIEEGLRRSRYRDNFDITSCMVIRLVDLRRALLDYEPQIVHFLGHGAERGLMLEDDVGNSILMAPEALSRLFDVFSTAVNCIILHGYDLEEQANAISKHINHVIQIDSHIEERAAVEFSVGFYDALGAGKSIEEAFEFGCYAIQSCDPDTIVPILKRRSKGLIIPDLEMLGQLQTEIGIELFLYKNDDNRIESSRNTYAIDKNKNIVGLNLSENHLAGLPKTVPKLKNLKKLVLTNNQFETFPLEILELPNLDTLYLGGNKLKGLLREVTDLRKLQHMFLDSNQLDKFPIAAGELTHFKVLDLRDNLITELPKGVVNPGVKIKWGGDREHEGIYLEGNPFELPPVAIVKQGKEAVKIYYDSLEEENRTLKEIKILLVGDGGASKTSLVKLLCDEEFDGEEPKTDGININSWYFTRNNVLTKVNLWDFGGQEVMHATHQFFFSKRSLYILVLDGRKEGDPEYWLKNIESFGGDSPILIVLNKIDENPRFEVNRRFLQDKYKRVKGFSRLSCAQGTGLDEFSKSLCNALSDENILNTTWMPGWFNIKRRMEDIPEHYISYNQFIRICEEDNVVEESSQESLVDFLHDLGVILHFREFSLQGTHVLEPKWVTNAVYKIINSDELEQSNGVLNLSLLDDILKKNTDTDYFYPPDKNRYIIDLMVKFELCYEIDGNTVLIPDLLDCQEPPFDFDYKQSLKFLIEYDFLPKSVIPRFIVKMHKDIKERLSWRTGIVLEDRDLHVTAVVKADQREKKIYIYVNGEQKRTYFSEIRKAFKRINESFEKLEFVELIPLPDNNDVTVEYQELLGLERMRKSYITFGKLGKEYPVKQLLDGIEIEEWRTNTQSKAYGRGDIHIKGKIINIGNVKKEVENMSKNSIRIGDNANIINSIVSNKIKDSFNKADASNTPDKLKDLLKSLAAEIGKINELLPKEQAEQVANDLQALTNEAISEKPRKKWWELSVSGIKEAAQSVGTIGKSALTILKELIPVLTEIS